ncbi:MAG: hypothetical protein U0932_13735 [Thiobacillus sp.]|nr:hypothetical protein [Thiobacillus sp.]MDP2252668.1 hypothetical protein [Thiobacillus sp.]MDP2978635.1 hypothetical protein [Thiobacillus sp.]MDZ7595704.1 hypothetical protein [Thiobacillus sp.]
MFPRRLLAWLFALTLLFGQATAFAHAVSHLDMHDGALPDKVCEVCVAQANLGSAAPATVFSLPIETAGNTELPAAAQPLVTACFNHAQARAPPVSI